ncbi:GTP cyclohydrolase I [Cellulophaga phage phi19:2]|uniref:GTP cyclohydrolase I n=3 Tax=Cellulophaga phage phiST TaxID=756282 RepID=R9ZXV4_9CAUD|nr:GTP cyclohydrolase I [Cellulophaga phage phiST]AGO48673.1 GTP cyclohydrolase I [Cellulophaga phage phi19:2]
MSKKFVQGLEIVKAGMANGISTQLSKRQKQDGPKAILSDKDKAEIIENAAIHFGKFLTALGCDWENDPNSSDTPRRVAKAYVNDLWVGRYNPMSEITGFPSDGYDGIVQESNIPLMSMCSHHHQTIEGHVSIAYIASEKGKVVGLSKLNRLVELLGRRGAIQEQLTVAIHNAVDKICEGNEGVAVHISASHNCVKCRGVKHQGAAMQTAKISGLFKTDLAARNEFYSNIQISKK